MRAIDADALTEDCKRYLCTLNPDRDGKECTRIHWLIGVLGNTPTIEPEPHWIPCKERMPDKDGAYIVSGKWEDGEISVGECDYSTEDRYFNASWRFTVLAWMEKPEPYQEGKE